MGESIQLLKHGRFTIPTKIREKYHLEDGEIINLEDMNGLLVITPHSTISTFIAEGIEKRRQEIGVSTDELLDDLRIQREFYNGEKFDL